jgi:hypothetical protein
MLVFYGGHELLSDPSFGTSHLIHVTLSLGAVTSTVLPSWLVLTVQRMLLDSMNLFEGDTTAY